ncbi:hypothetical protein M0D65_22200 [Paraburkholderia sp. CHISQ3]|nr:hypothetical protein [Paraburkholderia sp. CHISQ3]
MRTPGTADNASARLSGARSLIDCWVTTLTACGTSINGVSVRVATDARRGW